MHFLIRCLKIALYEVEVQIQVLYILLNSRDTTFPHSQFTTQLSALKKSVEETDMVWILYNSTVYSYCHGWANSNQEATLILYIFNKQLIEYAPCQCPLCVLQLIFLKMWFLHLSIGRGLRALEIHTEGLLMFRSQNTASIFNSPFSTALYNFFMCFLMSPF